MKKKSQIEKRFTSLKTHQMAREKGLYPKEAAKKRITSHKRDVKKGVK